MRKGYSVNTADSNSIKNLDVLSKNGFVNIALRKTLTCKRCKKQNLLFDDNVEKFISCLYCTRRIFTSDVITEKVIENVNYEQIIKIIHDLISKTKFDFKFDKHRNYWVVTINDKKIPILIPDISSSSFVISYSEKEASMLLTLDKTKNISLMNSMNSSQFVEFQSVFDNVEEFRKKLEFISTTFDQNYSQILEQKFDEIMNKISPYDFERFCVDLLEELKTKYEKLHLFYNYLNRWKDTVINYKVIKLGGPGSSDFSLINLYDYLRSGLKPGMDGEVKRLKTSTFTYADFGIARAHSRGRDTLILISTDDVQIEVWNDIIALNENGHYKAVLLDKDLLLVLIKCMELSYLLDKYDK
ncbi:MAG: hypothetical protein KGI19_07200 [Thaumarchaeota archaeon]|nr:hypothetical protein [Nitrososphaerota archaeon]